MSGILYAFLSAFSLAFSNASSRRAVLSVSASQGLYITVVGGVPLFLIAALVSGQLFDVRLLSAESYAWLAGAGVLHFLFGRYCSYRTLAAMGANRAQPINQANALVSVVIAVIFLSEVVTPLMASGIALIMVGPALAAWSPRRAARSVGAASASEPVALKHELAPPRLAEGYTWAILNALAFGTSPVFIRHALGDSGLGVLGGLVAYAVAAGVLLLALVVPSRRAGLLTMDRTGRGWFAFSGVATFLAQMFRFMALSLAPVSVVVPIQRLNAPMTFPVSFLMNRDVESFEPRLMIGMAIAVVGAIMVVV